MVGSGAARPPAISTLPVQSAGAKGCAALVRAFDWSRTSLGPIGRWDPSVRTAVDLLLESPVPMMLVGGHECLVIYNDAYAEVLGDRHPAALGRPAVQAFGDAWDQPGMSDVIGRVFRTGHSTLEPESQVTLRPGGSEPAFYTRGHSAVRDSHGVIAGVLTVAAETTQVVHRLQSLGELTARLAGALTIDDVTRVVLSYAMTSFDLDHCVLAVDDGSSYRFVRRIRGEMLDEADERLPPVWRHLGADPEAPLVAAAETGRATFVSDGEPLRA